MRCLLRCKYLKPLSLSQYQNLFGVPIQTEIISNCTTHFKDVKRTGGVHFRSLCSNLIGIPPKPCNKFACRTHTCGELNETNIGQSVKLCGWIQYQRLGKFVILRDSYGSTQLIVPDEKVNILEVSKCPYESVIEISGTVMKRPEGQQNKKMYTGAIEVVVENLRVLNQCQLQLPFNMSDYSKAKESLRMKYRYLDLRSPDMQKNLRLRSAILMKIREYFCTHCNFIEVETPTLFRRTPGGAQEYVVPTQSAGLFYSLVQSPQQFKQLLMVGGIDRYFQIARCYRDEGSKPDRQPEFTQLDVELSFTNQEEIMSLIEGALKYSWPSTLEEIHIPFPQMTYSQAMEEYGSDKPDTSFGVKIQDITSLLKTNLPSVIQYMAEKSNFSAKVIVIPEGAIEFSQSVRKEYEDICRKQYTSTVLMAFKVKPTSKLDDIFYKLFSFDVYHELMEKLKLQPYDLIIISIGPREEVLPFLGQLRVDFVNRLSSKGISLRKESKFNFVWITDFPLFIPGDLPNSYAANHHPFTLPHPDDMKLLYEDPLQVRGLHYDLVLNGSEIGGGSMRIHNSSLQQYILKHVLKIDPTHLHHLLEALQSGCPPHGGIALGVDRLMAMMCETSSIRDVMAFPKSSTGKDLMSGAPVELSEEDKQLYHIQIVENSAKNSFEKI